MVAAGAIFVTDAVIQNNYFMSDCCLTKNEQIFSYILMRTSYILWNDDALLILDQHAYLDFYCAKLLKQQSEGRYVTRKNYKNFSVMLRA